jgi:hypothetical protein
MRRVDKRSKTEKQAEMAPQHRVIRQCVVFTGLLIKYNNLKDFG